MFAFSMAFKFQKPVFTFSILQLLKGKYVIPTKPRKQRNQDLASHQEALQQWQQKYEPPKRPTFLSEQVTYYGKIYPHLKSKFGELFAIVKKLPVEQQEKDLEIIKKQVEEKRQIYLKRLEDYDHQFYVKKGTMTPQSVFFSQLHNIDFKAQWNKYNELSQEEKQKYRELADIENQKLNEKKQKLAQLYGISLEEFNKELRTLSKLSKKKQEEKSSSSDDDEKKESKSEKKN